MQLWTSRRERRLIVFLLYAVLLTAAGVWSSLKAVFTPYESTDENQVFKPYFMAWLISGALASILLLPTNTFTGFAFLTFGFGVIAAILAVTVFIYLTCFLPTAYCWTSHRRKAFVASFLLAILAATGPRLYLKTKLESQGEAMLVSDFAKPLVTKPDHIEFRFPLRSWRDMVGSDYQECPSFCRDLLSTKQAKFVTIVRTDTSTSEKRKSEMTFCWSNTGAATCSVPAAADRTAGLVVDFETVPRPYYPRGSKKDQSPFKRTDTIVARTASPILKRTRLVYENWTWFTVFPLSTLDAVAIDHGLPEPHTALKLLGYDVSAFNLSSYPTWHLPFR